ncbi:MAG: PAS domain S-box protein [Gemmatimonadales bacterium]|nr:PAS domain S-box protein [Gemmatimonadales bacterium]
MIQIRTGVMMGRLNHRDDVEAAQQVAKFLDAVLCASVDGIVVTDATQKIIQANEAFCALFGKCRREVIETNLDAWLLQAGDNAMSRWADLELAARTRSTCSNTEFEFRDSRGARHLKVNATLVDQMGTEETGVVISVWRDIIEQKHEAENSLSEKAHIIRSASSAIATADLDGWMTYVNPAFLELWGFDDEQKVKGHHFTEFWDVGDRLEEIMPALLDGQGVWSADVKARREDGSLFDAQVSAAAIYNSRRELTGLMSTTVDITDRKLAEEERLNLERQVQHVQKLQSLCVLAGGIANDFNDILLVIQDKADSALHELAPGTSARMNVQEIERASRRAAELAKQMLAYAGQGEFDAEPIRLGDFVEGMAHLLEVSLSKKALLRFDLAGNLPIFHGDATQLRQLILCLITNAAEAIGDQGGQVTVAAGEMYCDQPYLDSIDVSLRTGSIDLPQEGSYVYLEVSDTGCGMDSKTIAKVFDPFFTTKSTGRGLGMAVVQGIVHGHNGVIKIFSEIGQGTTLKILFPASETPEKSSDHDTDEIGNWCDTGTVLIVDDEETILRVTEEMLKQMGLEVLAARDGQEGLDVFREHSDEIGCVLLDLNMPGVDGLKSFRAMRRIRPNVNAILCSGYSKVDAATRFAGTNLAGFLQKPYTIASLGKALAAVLPTQNRGQEKEMESSN